MDQYPQWMRDFCEQHESLNEQLHEKRLILQQSIKEVDEGLREVELKEQEFRRLKNIKPLVYKQEEIVGDYKLYYSAKNLERNLQLKNQQINPYIMAKLCLFQLKPIQFALKMSRVSQRWNIIANHEYVWKTILGALTNETMSMDTSHAQDLCIYFEKQSIAMMKFFNENTHESEFTGQQIRDCHSSLAFIQQILSIPANPLIKQKVLQYTKTQEFKCSLELLITLKIDLIRQEALQLYIALSKINNFAYKRIQSLSPLNNMIYHINQETGSAFITQLYYQFPYQNKSIKLRDQNTDLIKVKQYLQGIKQAQIYLYQSDSRSFELKIQFEKEKFQGSSKECSISGYLQINQITNGLQSFAVGYLEFKQKQQSHHFLLHLCEDLITNSVHILGSENLNFILIKLQ